MEQSPVQSLRKKLKLFSLGGALLVGGILLAVNFIADFVPLRLDTSQGSVYSITRGSKEIVKQLDDTLVVKIVFSSQLPPPYKFNEQYVGDLLSEYKRSSNGKIRVEYFDPTKTPQGREEAIRFGVSPVQLDVRERDRREVKECFMGVALVYGDKRESIPVVQDTNNLEYEITVRLRKLVNPNKPVIGFSRNGGAWSVESQLQQQSIIKSIQPLYQLEDVDLKKPVPANVKSLWLIAPTEPLSPVELANLRSYVSSGGCAGILVDRFSVSVADFKAHPRSAVMDDFFADWGLKMRDALVVDPRADRIQIQTVQGAFRMINIIDYPYFPWVTDLSRTHPATKGLDGISLPFVAPIEIIEQKPGFVYTPLARSSDLSYLDTRPSFMNPMQTPSKPADAPNGPFNLGLLAENGNSRLILFSTSRFVDPEYPAQINNYNLLVNLMDWSVQDNALIQIRSKGFERRPLKELSDGARYVYKYVIAATLPLLSLIIGIVVWRQQKVRRSLLPLVYKEG